MTQKSPLWLTCLSLGFLALWLALASVPFIWTLWGSFKVEADFFSRQDWRNAIYGVRTLFETGNTVTGAGYEGAWIKEDFWKATINTTTVHGARKTGRHNASPARAITASRSIAWSWSAQRL